MAGQRLWEGDLTGIAPGSYSYNKSTVYVPAAKDLYLDYVDFSEPCGVAYCNTEYKGMGRRDLTQIMNPKGGGQ